MHRTLPSSVEQRLQTFIIHGAQQLEIQQRAIVLLSISVRRAQCLITFCTRSCWVESRSFQNPTPHIEIDLGCYFPALPGHITLSTIEDNHPNKPPQVTVYPLLHGCLQSLTNYGAVFCKQPATGDSIKIYPGLTHVLKAQSKNFLTLPKTVMMLRHRLNEVRNFLRSASGRSRAAGQHSCLTRFELSTTMEVSLRDTLTRAQVIHEEILSILDPSRSHSPSHNSLLCFAQCLPGAAGQHWWGQWHVRLI